MKTQFTARHFQPSDQLKQFSLDAVDKLHTFHTDISSIEIVLEPGQDADCPQKADLRVKIPGDFLTASVEEETFEKAVLDVVDVVTRQLRKFKTKHATH
ncbi:MAG: ribosome-associated translation inhibitor RaiA [Balneolaceae bacterium]|nr:ribosome-associated translation inhibitor RaiA [Balneolaceae bacterium]MDR9446183.1 ribosome-associated translation inhibitor RaiA [Balneolaceae bacterium]